jgi:hypothetical protein
MAQETTLSFLHQYYTEAENMVPQTIESYFCDQRRHVQYTLKDANLCFSRCNSGVGLVNWEKNVARTAKYHHNEYKEKDPQQVRPSIVLKGNCSIH